MRIAKPWPREKLRPEDFIAGTVTERTQSKLVLALEAGTLAGEELEPGDWRRVHLSGVLVSWVECDEPVVGEKVVIRYLGRFGLGDKPTFDFACAVHREPPPAPWE
jgi:hypothetical protein